MSASKPSRTVTLNAKSNNSLLPIFTRLEKHGVDLHAQILETILVHHLALSLAVDDPAARDFALISAHLLEAQARMIRDRFNLKTAPIAVVNSLATSDRLTANSHREERNLDPRIKSDGFSFSSYYDELHQKESPPQLDQSIAAIEEPPRVSEPVDPRKSKLEEMGINLG